MKKNHHHLRKSAARRAAGDQAPAVPTLVHKVPITIQEITGVLPGLNIRPIKNHNAN